MGDCKNSSPILLPLWFLSMSRPDTPPHEFSEWVHDALNRLYDSPYLQTHPLVALLCNGEADRLLSGSQCLRRVLLQVIQSMRPGAGVPARSPDWRAFRILELRYIEGLGPAEAMARLGLSKSQYFREQARVLEMFTEAVWARAQQNRADRASAAPSAPAEQTTLRQEVEGLASTTTWESVNVAVLLEDLMTLIKPLAENNAVTAQANLAARPIIQVNRIVARQAILKLLTCALEFGTGSRVDISTFAEASEAGIVVAVRGSEPNANQGRAQQTIETGLALCRQLMKGVGGTLTDARKDDQSWEARLALPIAARVLLVVDDNREYPNLFRRYLAGYNWRVIGAHSVEQARRLITEVHPAVVTLDVLMPGEDGWELLVALKRDARTQAIPVIVCSILDEPRLALALGATQYLPKPVTQQSLLQALETLLRSADTTALPKP